ncbi:hypothetical protein Tco_1093252 [Tanacetum coccineum]|uniref:Uncharacterized protein n=1 Tax=Tanacetum coccineum TaxID=301880 RepID=A0ABQ5IC55_9ASTR
MNPQEIQQVTARDEKRVPSSERVKISSTNIILETTVPQKEETFQVVIDLIKNSTCFKAFTISADIPEIFMQQFWYTIKKVKIHLSTRCDAYPSPFLIDMASKGMFYRENADYPALIWEDVAFQIDHRKEKRSRRENMPFP